MPHRATSVVVMSIVLAAGALTGCSSGSEAVSATQGPTASAAPAVAAELDPASFAAALKRPGTTVVDVRTPAEFADGHLSGAVNLDVSSPDFTGQLAQLDPAGRYAVYCRSGNRSAAAVTQMGSMGLTAYHLAGGITAWQGAGGDVVSG